MSSEWLLKRWISFASYFPTTRAGFAPEHIVIVAKYYYQPLASSTSLNSCFKFDSMKYFWLDEEKKQNSQKVFQKKKAYNFSLNIALINRTPDKLPNRKVIWNLELKNITNERIRHMRFGLLIYF